MSTHPPGGDAATAPAVFRYADVPPEHRDWLRGRAEYITSLAYRTVCDYVRIGQTLADARARLRRRAFRVWVAAELPFSRSWAYKLMAVAKAFGPHVRPDAPEVIETRALVILSAAPPGARAFAVEQAKEGVRVTAELAREIVAAHRPVPDPTRAETRDYVRATRDLLPKAPPAAVAPSPAETRAARSWALVERLAGLGGTVTLTTVDDADGEDAPYYVSALLPTGRRGAVRRSLADAVAAVLGEEEARTCPTCRRPKPVSDFGENATRANGRARCCRECERKRLLGVKARAKAAKKGPPAP